MQSRSSGASNIRIAVVTIVAIHVVFFGGLLLQGCKRDTKLDTAAAGGTTDQSTNNLNYPPMTDTNMYYTNTASLPPERPNPIMPGPTNPEPRDLGASSFTPQEPLTTNNINHAAAPSGETKDYTVAKNDSFYKIAKANGITVAALTRANPNADPHKLKVGQKLKIPVAEAGSTAARGGADASGAPGSSYTVKSGDTLTKIAKSHGVTVSDLRAANGFKTSRLSVGQKIKIPEKRERTAAGTTTTNAGQPRPL